jgi:hypothetical protein
MIGLRPPARIPSRVHERQPAIVPARSDHKTGEFNSARIAGSTRLMVMSPTPSIRVFYADRRPIACRGYSKAVLFESNRNGTRGIFKQGISQDTAESVVTGPQDVSAPRLSADGAWIFYREIPKTQASRSSGPPDAHPGWGWRLALRSRVRAGTFTSRPLYVKWRDEQIQTSPNAVSDHEHTPGS